MANRMVKLMIRGWIPLVAALLVPLVGGNSVIGQQPPAKDVKPAPKDKPAPPANGKPAPAHPEKSAVPSLQELLTQALKGNPDIRVAETKLREAEADLNRTRLQVTRKVVALHQALKNQQAQVEAAAAKYKYAEATLKRFTQLQKERATTQEVVTQEVVDEQQANLDAAKAALMAAKATLAQTEAELPYLLGKYPQASSADSKAEQARLLYLQTIYQAQKQFDEWANSEALKGRQTASPPLPTAMADKIRKALNTPVKLEVDSAPLADVLAALGDKTGVSFHIKDTTGGISDQQVRLRLKEAVPLAAALQAIGDFLPDARFVVRDYGILVADQNDLPHGAVLVENFWKAEQAKEKPATPSQAEKPATGGAPAPKAPPPGDVKGTIQAIDSQAGLVSLNLGSDAGLQAGTTLEVYRLKPKPLFVGTVRVVGVTPTQAVAKPVSPLRAGPIQQGDHVAGQILSRR